MTTTLASAETQVSLALDAIQSKRRLEHVVAAANALVDRFAARSDIESRVRTVYELIRRNFASDVEIVFGDVRVGHTAPTTGVIVKSCG